MTRMPSVAIAIRTILFTLSMVALLLYLEHLAAFLHIVILASILAAAMVPAVAHFQQRRKQSRLMAVGAVFGLLVLAASVVSVVAVPVLIEQTRHLATHLPEYTGKLAGLREWAQGLTDRYPWMPSLDTIAASASENARHYLKDSLGFAGKMVGAAVELLIVFVTAFFMLVEGPHLKAGALAMLPPRYRELVGAQIDPIVFKLGGYVQGMLISIVTLTIYLAIVLVLFHVPLALVLALLGGLCAIVPLIGGYIGLIPITLVALMVSWQVALAVAIVAYVGVWLVGHVLMPVVFSKSVHLSPLMVMLALLLGVETLGVFGALTAVPILAAVQVLLKGLYMTPMEQQHAQADGRVKCSEPLRYHLVLTEES